MGGVLLNYPLEHLFLRRYVPSDGTFEGRVSYLVSAVGEGREEAARQLVLSLGAGLQEFETPGDGEVDSLVVA